MKAKPDPLPEVEPEEPEPAELHKNPRSPEGPPEEDEFLPAPVPERQRETAERWMRAGGQNSG